MDELFQTIRESCSTGIWSKAVELVRTGEFAAAKTAEGITVNISSRESAVQPIVTLIVDDLDWHCTCPSDENPCHHVAAAIIAIRRSREKGQELPQASEDTGRLSYHFFEENQRLLLRRIITTGSEEHTLMTTLSALTSGRIKGPKLISTPTDMEIDVLIGSDRSGSIPTKNIPQILKLLLNGDCTVSADGIRVTPQAEPKGMIVCVSDDGPGIRVTARAASGIKKIFGNGFALTEDLHLHPAVIPESSPFIATLLKTGMFYGRQEFGAFVSNILPDLQARYPVTIQSKQLPRQGFSKPRLELHLSDHYPEGLQVTASIVYGDPVDTRVSNGCVFHTGDKISVRSADDELVLKDHLWRLFNLELGPPVMIPSLEAINLVAKLAGFKGDITGEGYESWRILGEIQPVANWQDEIPGFSFAIPSAPSGQNASPETVARAWADGQSLVRLTGGGFAKLPATWLKEHGEVLAWINAIKEQKTLGTAAKKMLVAAAGSLGLTPPSSGAAMRERFESSAKASRYFPKLNAELRPYQSSGIEWLHTLADGGQGGILADDMGLGKTIQAISLLRAPSLVVAPTSVVFNWQREIQKFRPELTVCMYHGKDRILDQSSDVIITSYNLVRMAPGVFKRKWDIVIADEAQFIKNPESQIFSAMCSLEANARFALTGTPIENRLDDLWAQMEFANPGLLGSRRYFSEVISSKIGKDDQNALQGLRQKIKPYFLRRLKTEVARDLPARTNIIRSVELSEKEQGLYTALLQTARADIQHKASEDVRISALHILELLLRLRQACCHPNLLPDTTGYESAKVTYATELIATLTENQHKILVFSQWTSYLDLIQDKFTNMGLPTLRLDGSTTDRQGVVDRFQDPATEKILLMSLKAGGTGLNLTAADHVFIMDPWWNPAAEEQASNRAWRIGQDKPVFVHKLVAAGTIEEKILQLQDAKQQLSNAVTGGDFAVAPTIQEILGMLES